MNTKTCLDRIRTMAAAVVVLAAPMAVAGSYGPDTRTVARSLGLEVPAARDGAMIVRPTSIRSGVRKAWLGTKDEPVKVYADSMATVPVLFELGGNEIRTDHATSVMALRALAAVMRAYPNAKFVIEGHTCDLGSERDNIEISWGRAESVKAQLMLLGVDPQRLTVLGFGESEAPRHFDERDRSAATERARQAYRRVVVRQVAG